MTWLRKPWVGPLAFVVVAFVAFSLPPYLTGDRLQARVQSDWGPHFPLLVVHVVCASIAIITCVVQIWPWFRGRFPVWHRRIGRVYVFAGVLPAGLSGLVIGWMTPFGPVAQVSNVLLAVLWLAFTGLAWRAARRRQFRDHRKWMIRSFVLTVSIITNRIWGAVAFLLLADRVPEAELPHTIAGIATWTGWTIPLLLSQWWLERKPRRRAAVEQREAISVS
ncbi:Uncharacterized membrane protein [Lentzea albidocapillata subsp. violacea]|uniref:Uncharacterized membrane protein n=1 Tax=Lentzea albidocapillata subsp. violacea TaxID=128104 RepID=A0A1G8XBR4_9PSEU|nr:DUF2306 domain-containing protein [Lentzea albidocapillata]SDJ88119.1 Uncharacterized membrane protein [Lentzea albidocapillata subsp. violacea]